jgi:hypothetical protein
MTTALVDELNNAAIDALLDQIDMQRVEIERRMISPKHSNYDESGRIFNRRSTDPGYSRNHGTPWEFENITQDVVIPVILGEIEVQS